MAGTDIVPSGTAKTWVDNWRNPQTQAQRDAKNSILELNGFWFPGEDFTNIMNESGAVNGRTYFAIDEDNVLHLLFVGVDSDGNDLIDDAAGLHVYDLTKPCPPMCSQTGPLK